MELKEFFQQCPKVALGFSGGVDSAYLLYAAVEHGAQVRPYFIKTQFQPQFELEDAKRLAAQLAVEELTVLELDVLQVPHVAENGPDRCYHCKRALFGRLRDQALADGYTVLIDGTNASDDAGDRPGIRALGELFCPFLLLRECGSCKSGSPQPVRERERGCSLGTSRHMLALQPESPPGTWLMGKRSSGWKQEKTPCSSWAFPTCGCGCTMGLPGCSFRESSCKRQSSSGKRFAKSSSPGSTRCFWI